MAFLYKVNSYIITHIEPQGGQRSELVDSTKLDLSENFIAIDTFQDCTLKAMIGGISKMFVQQESQWCATYYYFYYANKICSYSTVGANCLCSQRTEVGMKDK